MLVHLVLVRHAEAVEEDADRIDGSRFLSAAGRAQAHALGRALAASGLSPERIATSPFVRAVQTAEIIAAALGGERLVEVVSAMAPTRNARTALELLGKSQGLVLAVGHEPHLSSMAAVILGQASFPALRKAQAIAFEGKQPRWTLGFADTEPLPWQAE